MANPSFLHIRNLPGKGGRRKGFVARNEIEDMRLFDADPGKEPSLENGSPPSEGPESDESADFEAPGTAHRRSGKH